jgi:outer membrane protein assembly factor BamD
LFLLFAASCSEYNTMLKKGSNDEKYDYVLKLLDTVKVTSSGKVKKKDRDYVRALPLLEDLLAVYRGKEKSEEIYLKYAYCYYGLGQYELAAFHFKNFTENYYNSKYIEECSYRYVSCLYLNALPYYLDQTNTTKAINEIQLFLNQYPNSIYKDHCNNHMDELRKTLKNKAFQSAMLYFKLDDYLAAMVTCKNAIRDFPDIDNKEEIEFTIVKSAYLYAKNSIEEKKEERYLAVFTEYKEYIKNNKLGSPHYAEVNAINEKAKIELEKHKKLNKIQ